MREWRAKFSVEFSRKQKKLKKHPELHKLLKRKIAEILEKPFLGKPLRYVLKGKRRVHLGSYVLIYRVDECDRIIIFLDFDHHNNIYRV